MPVVATVLTERAIVPKWITQYSSTNVIWTRKTEEKKYKLLQATHFLWYNSRNAKSILTGLSGFRTRHANAKVLVTPLQNQTDCQTCDKRMTKARPATEHCRIQDQCTGPTKSVAKLSVKRFVQMTSRENNYSRRRQRLTSTHKHSAALCSVCAPSDTQDRILLVGIALLPSAGHLFSTFSQPTACRHVPKSNT